jgi:hypothetical protein
LSINHTEWYLRELGYFWHSLGILLSFSLSIIRQLGFFWIIFGLFIIVFYKAMIEENRYLTELLSIETVISFLVFINWGKMTLGAVLILIGIFGNYKYEEELGVSSISTGKFAVTFRKVNKFIFAIIGLILIGKAILDGIEGFNFATSLGGIIE